MSTKTVSEKPEAAKKPGLISRMFQKLDASMKRKAEASSQSCCCGDSDSEGKSSGRGGKCC